MTLPVHRPLDRQAAATVAGLGGIAAYFAVVMYGMSSWDYQHWMLLWLGPVLFGSGVVIITAVTRDDAQPLTRLFVVALAVKLAASLLRYYVSFSLYGSGDALQYDLLGADIANAFHRGDLTVTDVVSLGHGTQFVTDFTGLVYTVIGPSHLGGYLVYSWLGFWGLFLFHRAALVGLPEGNQRRYALLVCFLPSLVFWPSSIGKEALMMLSLGVCALGTARLLERRRGAWPTLIVGLTLSYLVRPHVGVVVLAALVVAVAFRRRAGRDPVFGPVGRVVTVGLLVVSMAFVLSRAVDRLLPYQSSSTGVAAVGEVLDRAESGTDEGGSEIDRPSPGNPLEYPRAAFTVLFRPTILEAKGTATTIAALETTFLVAMFVAGWRRLRTAGTLIFRRPYVLFCVVYTAIFAFAWSAFANLGALARQRVQVWPLLLILLAVPVSTPATRPVRPVRRATSRPATSRGLTGPTRATAER
ncbi:MAG: hypothetical protein ACK5OX_17305 [Desertimonas sp.]